MNKFLYTFIVIFCLFFSIQAQARQGYSSDICIGCDPEMNLIYYLSDKVATCNFILSDYEMNGEEHKLTFDYHVGFISGKYAAYRDILKLLEDN